MTKLILTLNNLMTLTRKFCPRLGLEPGKLEHQPTRHWCLRCWSYAACSLSNFDSCLTDVSGGSLVFEIRRPPGVPLVTLFKQTGNLAKSRELFLNLACFHCRKLWWSVLRNRAGRSWRFACFFIIIYCIMTLFCQMIEGFSFLVSSGFCVIELFCSKHLLWWCYTDLPFYFVASSS